MRPAPRQSQERRAVGRAVVLTLALLCAPVTSRAQVCGDADNSGSLAGADIYYLSDYLYDVGPAPVGPADVDSHAGHTVRDMIFITWNLVTGSPPLNCPPTLPALAPAVSDTDLLVYDETFPAGSSALQMRLFLKPTDSLTGLSLPLRIRVNGQVPAIVSVTFGPEAGSFDIRRTLIQQGQGACLLGACSFVPERNLPPGVHLLATVELQMAASGADRAIEVTWATQFPPMESGQTVHTPLLVTGDMAAVAPTLAGSCQADTDFDLVVDCLDACPGFDDAQDQDTDGVPDGCDLCPGFDDHEDVDNDGVPDGCDVCSNYNDFSDIDQDGIIDCLDACTDTDGDGLGNPDAAFNTCPDDNCAFVSNANQLDGDADSVGDVCDNCLTLGNTDQLDTDFDQLGDACDNCPGTYNPTQGDVDANGVGNACDPFTPKLQMVAHLYLDSWGTDCWGYTAPDGSEYAFYGGSEWVFVLRVTPNVEFIAQLPHAVSGWRDIKTYQHYVYAVSEGTSPDAGLLVGDLAGLPGSVAYLGAYPVDGSHATTSHNLSIDTVRGFAYLEGDRGNRSIHIHSLANPAVPAYVRSFGNFSQGIHDVYAYNDRLYVAEGSTSTWSIWNMTDKSNPVMLVRISVPGNGYMHNIWPTSDGKYCVTTEETPGRSIKFWDISDYGDVQLKGEYLAPSALVHNAHVEGDAVYISHYQSGVAVVNIADRDQPREFALFDTYPWSEYWDFAGCWGVYPHTQNNMVYASNMEGDFYVFKFDPGLQCPITLTGDMDGNLAVSVSDIIALANFVFKAAPPPSPCLAVADVNCNGLVATSDIISLVNYIFKSGEAPCDVCSLIPGMWSCP